MESSDESYQAKDHAEESSLLLRLPPVIRNEIYSTANTLGCDGSTFINLNQRKWLLGIPPQPASSSDITLSLLLTCKLIHNELIPMVYSRNHFYICYTDFMNLNSLRRLSTSAVRNLKKLTVHLNVTSCSLGRTCDRIVYWSSPEKRPELRDRHAEPFKLDEPTATMALDEWRQVWTEKVRPNLASPAQLQLHFICDVANLETGLKAVTSLLEGPAGILAGCSVRLSRRADVQLQELAEATVYRTVGSNCPRDIFAVQEAPFRFFDLPAEIQRHVLSFTDLITPFQEVEWSPPMEGMRWRSNLPIPTQTANPCDIHGHRIQDLCTSRCPGHCVRGCEQASNNALKESSFPNGCYCRSFHSASSNVYPCRCWIPPTALFLVSKAFYRLAIEVFYGSNHFIVTPSGGATYAKGHAYHGYGLEPPKLPASIFFQSVLPPTALPFIRFIELVFLPFGEGGPFDYCAPNTALWQDWIRTLDCVKDKLTLSSHPSTVCQ